MGTPLRVLLLEDRPADAELIVFELGNAGYAPEWERVDTPAEFAARLTDGLDLILADYALPQFTALDALRLLRESGREIPFIIVSGTIGEDTAVMVMKEGAADFLLKDRLERLGRAVTQALEQTRLRRERAEAQAALRRSEEDFRLLFASNPLPMWVYDLTTLRFLAVNHAAVAHYGYSEEEFLDRTIKDIRPPDDVPALMARVRLAEQGVRHGGVWRHVTKEGRLIQVRITSHPIQFRGQAAELILAQDVTQELENERALRESEERFRQVVENIREVFWMTDVAGSQLLYISPGYEAIWGRPAADLVAAPHRWIETVQADDRARIARAAKEKRATGDYDETYRIVRPDGTHRWVRERAFPVRGVDGAVLRIVGVAEDVTERKNLEGQFLRAQRMEAIGTLAGGVAHDLNNILAPVLMAASLLKEAAANPRDRDMLTMVERSAQRGADIIRQLLTFSRGLEGARGVLQPRHLLQEVETILRETFPRQIDLQVQIARDLWAVTADATQLHQVVINLCVNARDAMPDGGRLTLSAHNVEVDAREAAKWPDAKPGPYIAIAVGDTGTGIAPAIVEQIFDPFFTTKEVGKGTGLGLSTVTGIVTSHGGVLALATAVGEGSTFRVYLPALRHATHDDGPADGEVSRHGRGELILVVDDEASVREATSQVLTAHHYRVLTAANGREGLAVFLAHREEVALVLTDVMMPEMGGGTLVRSLRELKPGVKVVATSGLDPDSQNREFAALGPVEILPKPCSAGELLDVVRKQLAPARTG